MGALQDSRFTLRGVVGKISTTPLGFQYDVEGVASYLSLPTEFKQ